MHPGLSLLQRAQRPSRPGGPRRATARRRGRTGDGTATRRHHLCVPRRSAGWRSRGLCCSHPRDPHPAAHLLGGGADPGLQGGGAAAVGGDGRRPRHPQPQRRDGPPPLLPCPAPQPLRLVTGGAGECQATGCRCHDQERPDGRSGRDGRRGTRSDGGSARRRRGHPDHRAVPAAQPPAPSDRALLHPRGVRSATAGGAPDGVSPGGERPTGPQLLPRRGA